MGTVHVARDTELLRKVALKALLQGPAGDPSSRVRFIREVQITAQLDHPHIVPVYSLEVAPGGSPAYAMKLIEGRTFAQFLEEACEAYEQGGKPDEAHGLASRIEHLLKVCDAMAYAHSKGVIHRDLKPANVMLGRHNEIYLMDWGICRVLHGVADEATVELARKLSEDAGATREGSVVGTPAFMSPEQARGLGAEVGAASDQCALGLMLYTTVTLRLPFEGQTALEVLNNAAQGRLRPISHNYEGRRIPRELVAIIRRATALRPEQRYGSVREMADDLRRYLRGAAVQARPDNLWQKAGRAIGRHRQGALASMLGFVVLALGSQLYLIEQRQRAVERLRRHEERLQMLSAAIATRGDELQTRFLAAQSELESFAAAAEQALVAGEPSRDLYYLASDYRDPRRAPRDLAPAPGFAGRISRTSAVWTIPAGVAREKVDRTMRRLTGLRALRKRLFQRAEMGITGRPVDPATVEFPRALVGMILGLENGIASRFPGQEDVPEDYDPRTQPWYRQALHKTGTQWGRPFLSPVNPVVELPLSTAIYDDAQKPIGVASILLSVDFIASTLLSTQGLPAARELVLLDEDGDVLIDATHKRASAAGTTDPNRFRKFDDGTVLAAIAKGQRAVAETTHDGRRMIAAFDRIAPINWTLVALADEADLVKAAAPRPTPPSTLAAQLLQKTR
jgi:serine/threonine-protein kinase